MKITNEWLVQNKTKNNGYTRKQLKALGIDRWPPKRDWLQSCVGIEISERQRFQFEKEKV